jgi:hypothetical protein
MKPTHAAALALIAWYLLTPPLIDQSGVAIYAPIDQWKTVGSFPSQELCGQARQKLLSTPTNPHDMDAQHSLAAEDSQCVSFQNPPAAASTSPNPQPSY